MKHSYSPQDLASLCKQLAYLYGSGTSLERALELLEANDVFDVEAWKQGLKEHHRLSLVFEQDPAFPTAFVLAFKVAEEVGQEEKLCRRMAASYQRQGELDAFLKDSLTMPMVLVSLLIVVLGLVSWTILPLFQELMIRLGSAQSVALVAFLNGLKAVTVLGGILWILALVWVAVQAWRHQAQPTKYPSLWTKLLSLFPNAQLEVDRASFTFLAQLLLAGGVDNRKALLILPQGDKGKWGQRLSLAQADLKESDGLYELLVNGKLYPTLAQNTLNLAAYAGRLEEALDEVSSEMQTQAERSLQKSVHRFEPWLISGLTVLVFGILFAMILPLLGILSVMGA